MKNPIGFSAASFRGDPTYRVCCWLVFRQWYNPLPTSNKIWESKELVEARSSKPAEPSNAPVPALSMKNSPVVSCLTLAALIDGSFLRGKTEEL